MILSLFPHFLLHSLSHLLLIIFFCSTVLPRSHILSSRMNLTFFIYLLLSFSFVIFFTFHFILFYYSFISFYIDFFSSCASFQCTNLKGEGEKITCTAAPSRLSISSVLNLKKKSGIHRVPRKKRAERHSTSPVLQRQKSPSSCRNPSSEIYIRRNKSKRRRG